MKELNADIQPRSNANRTLDTQPCEAKRCENSFIYNGIVGWARIGLWARGKGLIDVSCIIGKIAPYLYSFEERKNLGFEENALTKGL